MNEWQNSIVSLVNHCRKTLLNSVAMAFAATALYGRREIEEKAATNVASRYIIATGASDLCNIRWTWSYIVGLFLRLVDDILFDVLQSWLSTLMRWNGHSAAWA